MPDSLNPNSPNSSDSSKPFNSQGHPSKKQKANQDEPTINWRQLQTLAPYPPEAFQFVSEGLSHTVRTIHGHRDDAMEIAPTDQNRHINGKQLCLGLRTYALQRYGLLARTVLHRWNIKSTEDFGKIVFAMVTAGLMRKTDEDTPEDFEGVFDFHEAFRTVREAVRD